MHTFFTKNKLYVNNDVETGKRRKEEQTQKI